MFMYKQICISVSILSFLFICQISGAEDLPDDFPTITSEIYLEDSLADGKIFLAIRDNSKGIGNYVLLLNNDGTPVWYKQLESPEEGFDFRLLANGYLSYGHGYVDSEFTVGTFIKAKILDLNYNEVDTFDMVNGYKAEGHGSQYLPNGHMLMFAYSLESFDLTEYEGYPYAQLAGTTIQELDAEKKLVNQWRFWDEYDLSIFEEKNLAREILDAVHTNSVELDHDGNLLMSSRAISTVAKINRQTGEVMWNLGGKFNDFSFIGVDSSIVVNWFNGHDLRRLDNGHISFFINNLTGSDPKTSKVAEFILDEENLTCELAWLYEPETATNSNAMGSAQKLPNDNYFIGWGTAPRTSGAICSEVTASKNPVMQMSMDKGIVSYRTHRFTLNTNIPADSLTKNNIAIGSYTFNSGDTINTGISLDITSLTESGSNSITVNAYDYSPYKPIFEGKDPLAYQYRIALSGKSVSTIGGTINFDINRFTVRNPDEIIIYHRATVGEGTFTPLTTSYSSTEEEISAEFSAFGEFMICYPDLPSLSVAPIPFLPAMGQNMNQEETIRIEWSPRGFIDYFTLQIATDSTFSNIVVDETNLPNPSYEFTPSENTTYYWRANTTNDAGTSDWSDTAQFSTNEPYIQITSPFVNDTITAGLDYMAIWESNLTEDLVVQMLADDALLEVIDTTDRFKYIEWEIPMDLDPDKEYRLVVSTLDYSVTDTSGIFYIPDNIFPTAKCKNATVYLNEDGEVSIDSSTINNGSSDNFKISTIQLSKYNFDCNNINENTITVVVSDYSGNTDTCTASVLVLDSANYCGNSIDNQSFIDGMIIYPNPLQDELNISLQIKSQQEIEIKLLDLTGKEIKAFNKIICAPGQLHYSFNISEIKPGACILMLQIGDNISYHKILISE